MELSKTVKDIRKNWAISDARRDEGLKTPEDIRRFDDIAYGGHGRENLLDVYVNKTVSGIQPTIVNIHGGGWVYGSKEVYQYYCMSLAQRGFTVVNINYRLAPESRFPAAVEDINSVMTFIAEHGTEFFIDKDNLVMVGDSAGGQLVSHYAAILTDPGFARMFDLRIPDVHVRALGLNCGSYDGKSAALSGSKEVFAEYLDIMDSEPSDKLLERIDTLSHITADFPPSFVMSAYCDFLLPAAQPMYDLLKSKGIDCVMKIYGSTDRPDIGHVFHVNCRLDEAKRCNDDECAFFRKYVG